MFSYILREKRKVLEQYQQCNYVTFCSAIDSMFESNVCILKQELNINFNFR